MSKGTTQGRVHEAFSNRLSQLKEKAKQIYLAVTTGKPRPWLVPDGWDEVDLTNPAAITAAKDFNRDTINTNYEQTFEPSKPGTAGDNASLQLQIAYNAVEERAFRSRHATVCRCLAHLHGRLKGHGGGGVFPAVTDLATDLIKAGGQA